ncbi:MAG: hypothetical protein K9N23_10710 [Akkermansiaceae bacterium]|nr:hypothetical protein [Akkermansiaceae bacterium]MCF7732152.1 hypothetical protein [Akkermansiaceae bacterium]
MTLEASNIGASVGSPLCIDVQRNGTLSDVGDELFAGGDGSATPSKHQLAKIEYL